MQSVVEDCASRERGGLLLDPIWSPRFFQNGYSVDDALLKAIEIALSKLSIQNPEMYRSIVAPLRESPFETIQYLLIRSMAANGALFANEAVDHLCEKLERLEIGYFENPRWATRQLIDSISPHCSDEKLRQLEALLLGYYPERERSAPDRRQYGYAQFTFLSGITAARRSGEVVKRLAELRRKFGQEQPEAPVPMKVEYVPSPIPEQAADKMSDDQWLSAIRQHNNEHGLRQDGNFTGGAPQLSRVLEDQVKQEPERFAELVLKFPDEAHPSYFEAVLRGISEANLDMDTIVRVCERCHRIEGRPFGRTICEPVANSAVGNVPPEALDLVAWYATEDPDPDLELWRTPVSHSGEFYYGGDIFNHGFDTARGRAAQAMARLIEGDQERIAYLRPTLEKMVEDPSIAVRSCVAQVLMSVFRFDRDLSVELFKQLCNTEDVLLQTRFVERFMFFALQTHFQELSPILERMVSSQVPEVASVGGRQACLAALDLEEAADIANLCLFGSEAQKVGAALVMAANVSVATCRAYCEDALVRLFDDPSEMVRSEAANCFRRFEEDNLLGYEHLIAQFVLSDAFPKNRFPLLIALERTTAKLPEVTLSACERFIDIAGLAAGDISTSEAGDANTVIKLALRTYQQSSEDAIRARSLDLIDMLMEYGAYGINDALGDFER